jgi:ApaG protein
MLSCTTNDITVQVETEFEPRYSVPNSTEYLFAYRITILNKSPYTVQLLRRHWFIHDGLGRSREVEGEGVIGEQPIIAPNESHQYISFCNLKTPIGHMRGNFTLLREIDGETFAVEIPGFTMLAPVLQN